MFYYGINTIDIHIIVITFVYTIICTISIIAISIIAICIENYSLEERGILSLSVIHATPLSVIIRSSPLLSFLPPGTIPSQVSSVPASITSSVLIFIIS